MLVETVLEEIAAALEADGSVKISSFGTFALRSKGQRMGRNPRTGGQVAIPPRRVVSFRASHLLKQRVNPDRAAG